MKTCQQQVIYITCITSFGGPDPIEEEKKHEAAHCMIRFGQWPAYVRSWPKAKLACAVPKSQELGQMVEQYIASSVRVMDPPQGHIWAHIRVWEHRQAHMQILEDIQALVCACFFLLIVVDLHSIKAWFGCGSYLLSHLLYRLISPIPKKTFKPRF